MRPILQPGRLCLNPATPGQLFKRPREARTPMRRAQVPDAPHLACIRQMPCCKCGVEPCGEAAHVRMSSGAMGKRNAMGAKPDDRWSAPLCGDCHRRDPDSQHRMGEELFWQGLGINPLRLAQDLHAASGDLVQMRAIVLAAIAGRSAGEPVSSAYTLERP